MKLKLIQIGKTDDFWLRDGITIYEKRIINYLPFKTITIPSPKFQKQTATGQMKKKEAELILNQVGPRDHVILLDEKGREFRSVEFARHMQELIMNTGIADLLFIIGGPYGFHEQIYQRANAQISLSQMTFSHQMIRLIFTEQLYRAMSILKAEPYHHE